MKNVFYFTADWCGPCKKVRPVVEDMIREGFHIQVIDVDIEKELVKNFEITSVPTFILFENEKQLDRISGAQTKNSLELFTNGKKQ
jgi:thioredoxin-like negative regulator of GroEL